MAISKAKKKRQKLIREGHLNPEIKRSPFALIDLSSKQKRKKDIFIVRSGRITKKMILFLCIFLSFHIFYILTT